MVKEFEGKKVGKVVFSDTYQIIWRVDDDVQWSSRSGGEYHVVEMPDGRLALLRWVDAESHEQGSHFKSLYLGIITNTPGELGPIEIPANKDKDIYTAPKYIIQRAFWQEHSSALQIACLTGTGDKIREWLYIPLKHLNRHLGIFAQSGSGKSYAVGRIIEELFLKLHNLSKGKKAHIILFDPNGDFEKFSILQKQEKILEKIDLTFQGSIGFVPQLSWEEWVQDQISNLNLSRSKTRELFPSSGDPRITWHWLDLRNDRHKIIAAERLSEIEWKRFGRKSPSGKVSELTFIVIDEAHNIVPKDLDHGSHKVHCQSIINKIAAEGRKYGLFLIIISQSPSKIHPDTLSQCANLLLMKTTTRYDIDTISNLRTDIPSKLIEKAARFKKGEGLFMGDFVPAPVTARIAGRITEEGGHDPELDINITRIIAK